MLISVTAAAFVSAAPRLWQDPAEPKVPWRGRAGASPADTFQAVNGSSGVHTNQQLENGRPGGKEGAACRARLLSTSPLLRLSLVSSSAPPPLPFHFHLTHGSSRSHHLTTPSPPTRNHLLPHDKHARAAITPQGKRKKKKKKKRPHILRMCRSSRWRRRRRRAATSAHKPAGWETKQNWK